LFRVNDKNNKNRSARNRVPISSSGYGQASIDAPFGLDPTPEEYAAAASETMIGPVRAADRRMNRFDVGTLREGIFP
jgi:hypothetical protein